MIEGDGRRVTSLITLEGNVLTHVQNGDATRYYSIVQYTCTVKNSMSTCQTLKMSKKIMEICFAIILKGVGR